MTRTILSERKHIWVSMYQSITYFDLPVLIGRGFKFGLTDEVLWGTDKTGKDWQAWIQGKFITFSTRMPDSLTMESHRKMGRQEFDELFTDVQRVEG